MWQPPCAMVWWYQLCGWHHDGASHSAYCHHEETVCCSVICTYNLSDVAAVKKNHILLFYLSVFIPHSKFCICVRYEVNMKICHQWPLSEWLFPSQWDQQGHQSCPASVIVMYLVFEIKFYWNDVISTSSMSYPIRSVIVLPNLNNFSLYLTFGSSFGTHRPSF